MKTSLLLGGLTVLLVTGCVVTTPEPPTVAVQTVTEPVYRPGYVVTSLPVGYRTVHYGPSVYYVNRGVYYRRHHNGYVVVTRPY